MFVFTGIERGEVMSQSMPTFWNSPYFVPEPDNWHLTDDAPEELQKRVRRVHEGTGRKHRHIGGVFSYPYKLSKIYTTCLYDRYMNPDIIFIAAISSKYNIRRFRRL